MATPFVPGEHTIFVVDGEFHYRAEVSSLLCRVGYRTRTFAAAEDVLRAVDVDPPTCVITEFALPGMSGLDLTRSLRSRGCLVPVIVLTRHGDVATAVEALRNSVADYLTRPFVERDLINRVRAALLPGHESVR